MSSQLKLAEMNEINDSFTEIDNLLTEANNRGVFTPLLTQSIQGNLTAGIVNFLPVWWRGKITCSSATNIDATENSQYLHLQPFTVLLNFVRTAALAVSAARGVGKDHCSSGLLAAFKIEGMLELVKQESASLDYLPLISILHYDVLGSHSHKPEPSHTRSPFIFQPKLTLVKQADTPENSNDQKENKLEKFSQVYEISLQVMWQNLNPTILNTNPTATEHNDRILCTMSSCAFWSNGL